jgi:two-component system response regulator VicR
MHRILVVDDKEDACPILLNLLTAEGYEVVRAIGGAEALRKLLISRPHLMILDMKLSPISGFEVCRAVKSSFSFHSLPVLMISVHSKPDFSLRARSVNVGAEEILFKPIGTGELLTRVKKYLHKNKLARTKPGRLNYPPVVGE